MKSMFYITILSLALTGCVSVTPLSFIPLNNHGPNLSYAEVGLQKLKPNEIQLVFIRNTNYFEGHFARIHINGMLRTNLNDRPGSNEFVIVRHLAGNIQIKIDGAYNSKDARQKINTKGGQTYYFLVSDSTDNDAITELSGKLIGTIADGGGRFVFVQIPESAALKKLESND